MNYELPSAPLSIGGVLDNALRLYRYVIGRCWPVALIYSVVAGAFGVIWELTTAQVAVPGADRLQVLPVAQVLRLMLSPLVIGGFLLVIVISMVFYGALVKSESVLARGDAPLSLGEAVAVGLRRMPGVLLGTLIFLLAIGVGFVLLIIPGIYLFGKLQLWSVSMFTEDASALDALKISWRLTRKRWWRGTAILSVAAILIYVFALAFGLVAAAIGALVHLGLTDRLIVNQIFSIASNVIVLPMMVAINLAMYYDFKLRGEGGDLAARVGSLGKA
jgi:hypothetical protein